MATTRTVQIASLTGAAPTVFTADGTGDNFLPPSSGEVYLRITNGGGSSINATLVDPNSVSPEAAAAFTANVVTAVPNGTSRLIKIADTKRFASASTGLISITWSAVTSVTFELFQ